MKKTHDCGTTLLDSVWKRLWSRIRRWQIPPRWSASDWKDESMSITALAILIAHGEYEVGRQVPLEAFLFTRSLAAVWTRYRQEWRNGRFAAIDESLHDCVPIARETRFEPPENLGKALARLTCSQRELLAALYWEGASMQEIAKIRGLKQEQLRKRKSRALRKLRSILEKSLKNA